MPTEIQLSGAGSSLANTLRVQLTSLMPSALGIASAFVSVQGLQEMARITNRLGTPHCRLVAGTCNAITHPEALTQALELGWDLRLGAKPTAKGIFHPKLIIAGDRFEGTGMNSPSFAYVGSSNLTHGGLFSNVECGFLAAGPECPSHVSKTFEEIWQTARPATRKRLEDYAKEFASRNRTRAVKDIEALGIADAAETGISSYEDLNRPGVVASSATIPTIVARAAWAGLESYTGEYTFQVEFPRAAGEVLRDLVKAKEAGSKRIPVFCTADGETREMTYAFYPDNGMFRLNIPNDVPGVTEARSTHRGIAVVEATKKRSAKLQLTVLARGKEQNRVVRRSFALGTWGRTPTRLYGWY